MIGITLTTSRPDSTLTEWPLDKEVNRLTETTVLDLNWKIIHKSFIETSST